MDKPEETPEESARIHTLECRCCGQRKPRTGFRLLASRLVPVCPECLPRTAPYLPIIEDFMARQEEQSTSLVLALIRHAVEGGQPMPDREQVAEQVDSMVPLT